MQGSVDELFFNDLDREDLDCRTFDHIGVAGGDTHQNVFTLDQFTEDAVFAVQPGSGDVGDEEL